MTRSEREAAQLEYRTAVMGRADRWVPACGGLEEPFTWRGARYLYCYNPAAHKHAYLNLDTDIPMPEFWFPAAE